MITVIVGAVALFVGIGLGGASVLRQVKRGRVVSGGRIYICKDTGPVIRL